MSQCYDLIVVGAGPAGLMAAKTAGEMGLKTALIERKEHITDINRACSMMIVTLSGRYLGDRVSINTRDKRLCFPGYGFSIPYDGRHQNFYSWSIYSYKGNKIQLGDYQKNESMGDQGRISATYDKSALLKSLLKECERYDVDVFPGHNVTGTQTRNGVVTVHTHEGARFNGTFVIGADGRASRLAKTLGKNRDRKYYGTSTSYGYEMAGVEPSEKYALFQIFLKEAPAMRIWMTPRADGETYFPFISCTHPGSDVQGAFERFISTSHFAPWFKHAQKIRPLSIMGNMYSHIVDPYKDQVLLVSDAVWCQEAEMTGAIISGWKAANAVKYAITEGNISREGVFVYLDWWRNEIINKLDHRDMIRNAVMPYCLSIDDIDYLLSTITKTLRSLLDPYETPKIVGAAMAEVMPRVSAERPDVFRKLQKMRTEPLEVIFKSCVRSGFPTTMRAS